MSTREEECSTCDNEMIMCVISGVWRLFVVSIANVVDRVGMVVLVVMEEVSMRWDTTVEGCTAGEDGTTVVDCTAGEEEVKVVPGNC